MPAAIRLFTKPDCSYCETAKTLLEQRGYAYEEFDITQSRRNAALSVYLSGVSAVPQIFIGEHHVNGCEDLLALDASGRMAAMVDSAQGPPEMESLSPESLSPGQLEAGAEDLRLKEVIPESDGTHSEDPEQWPILHFYKSFFGFWPHCFRFMHHWPEAYKLFVYAHNLGAIGMGREILGEPVMMATGFAASNAHGCNYCRIHMTAAGGEASLGLPELMEHARSDPDSSEGPLGPYELALADLAATSVHNRDLAPHLEKVLSLADAARTSRADPQVCIMGTAMIAAAFGFLNVFNDLTGVDVELEWAEQARSRAGIEPGRHAVSREAAYGNLDHRLPEGGPSMEEMLARHDAQVAKAGGVECYTRRELGLLPSWMQSWPEALQARHALFYTELMQERAHSLISSELKHLMARVSAIAKGHAYLAAVEGWLAHRAGGETDLAVERVRLCFEAAQERPPGRDCFNEGERAALRLAWLSAQVPLTTPRRFVNPAIQSHTPVELVHLVTVCALASLVQRFVAIVRPGMEPEVTAFLHAHGLESDTLRLRYPESAPSSGAVSRAEGTRAEGKGAK